MVELDETLKRTLLMDACSLSNDDAFTFLFPMGRLTRGAGGRIYIYDVMATFF